ncbi:MAG: Nif11-like leader peptide family RiPP precursor, partial [Prochlorococcus sp.]
AEGADVVAIAKAAGFSITSEDLQEHRQDLSDDELESVAGGNLEDLYTYIAC